MLFQFPTGLFNRHKNDKSANTKITGQCACGHVRYRLLAIPQFVHCCHCHECQRHTGSAFVINAIIETKNIKLTAGKPISYAVPTTSGAPHDIYHCPECQTALWSDYGKQKARRFVRVGTLDQPHPLKPGAHIYTSSKAPWLTLANDIPVFEAFYDIEEMWPDESLKRHEASLL